MRYVIAVITLAACQFLASCTSWSRDYSSWSASNLGANWIVVQYRFDGTPINCWKLHDVGISNETQSDGIYWKDSTSSSLVHISGWYNRVQVLTDDYRIAARLIGVDSGVCGNGKYPAEPTELIAKP